MSEILRPGGRVRLHQAFRCCPYAGMVLGQLHDYFEANGLQIVTSDPDVEVVHGCGSDAAQAQLSFDILGELAPSRAVLATGCLARIDPRGIERALQPFAARARMGPSQLDRLDDLFGQVAQPWAETPPSGENRYSGTELSDGFHHVLASTGCLGTCSFCAIRRATGRPTSRPIDAILDDLRAGLAQGERDLLIVSTDLSAWGVDLGLSVVDLLREVDRLQGDFLLLSAESFEPTLLLQHREALLPLLTSGRWAMLGVPIQSGSDRVLRQMSRTYPTAELLDFVDELRARAPGTLLRTDILYGFGDEDEDDFARSVEASRHFDLPSFNAYQVRPGTAPRIISDAALAARRALAEAELVRRAREGLRAIPRWGEPARVLARPELQAPAPAPDRPPVPVASLKPWETAVGRLWIERKARRLQALAPRQVGWGWRLAGAEAARNAVTLRLEKGDVVARLGLRPQAWPGACAWRTARLKIWSHDSVPEGLEKVVRALFGESRRSEVVEEIDGAVS